MTALAAELIAHCPVETLNIGVLLRLAKLNVILTLIRPDTASDKISEQIVDVCVAFTDPLLPRLVGKLI
jgi:hypothetical protein